VLRRAREAGVPVIGELELACRFCRAPIVAVTGTNGKTTTTALIGEIAGRVRPVLVGGNIGIPLVSRVEELPEHALVVAEVSSFQLATTDRFRPAVDFNFQFHLEVRRQSNATSGLVGHGLRALIEKRLEICGALVRIPISLLSAQHPDHIAEPFFKTRIVLAFALDVLLGRKRIKLVKAAPVIQEDVEPFLRHRQIADADGKKNRGRGKKNADHDSDNHPYNVLLHCADDASSLPETDRDTGFLRPMLRVNSRPNADVSAPPPPSSVISVS